MPLKPQGLGFRVWGLGFGIWGLGFGVWGLGFRLGVHLGFRLTSFPNWGKGWFLGLKRSGCRIACLEVLGYGSYIKAVSKAIVFQNLPT